MFIKCFHSMTISSLLASQAKLIIGLSLLEFCGDNISLVFFIYYMVFGTTDRSICWFPLLVPFCMF